MIRCLKKKECILKDILDILCNYKKFECKKGNFEKIKLFIKRKKPKAVILLINGNINEKKAKEYTFIISNISKTKNIVWAVNKNKKLSFKILAAL